MPRALPRLCSWLVAAWLTGGMHATTAAAPPAAPAASGALSGATDTLPLPVLAALHDARLPPGALAVEVLEVGVAKPRLAWREREPVNPASLMKLYTTGVALERLGPAWTWQTPVYVSGPVERGVLHGDLVIVGRGDPSLTIERVWLLLRQVRARGVREVRGDIVLDSSAFAVPGGDAGDFDGERLRPYNVLPDALLLNQKSLMLSFVPDAARGVASVSVEPPLAGVEVDASVPLGRPGRACGDWRDALKIDVSNPQRVRFGGSFPSACGDKSWPIAFADARSYNARLIESLWRELGGGLDGRVREGKLDDTAAQLLTEFASVPLAQVVRDINKFSNNVMAQQLFYTLPLATAEAANGGATSDLDAARALVAGTVSQRIGCGAAELVIDNGSGLSRLSRSSAHCLAAWLQAQWVSPAMPELLASLPVPGHDGTTRRPGRDWGPALGRAHLKTGSLRDVVAIAGEVLGASGRRYLIAAVIQHDNAQAGRPVLDALVQWTAADEAAAGCCGAMATTRP
ncbi:D-alanyl-D-alanine carboxypeptidase/D-alanyl-D-alanine endopeptidase [Caldimonas sp. KR1-144]|uniref:D-alanyl-D-alanine carboxypeptidase/D-alanyl-D-alanine endopeptidase n=1 Tax=Caldimonas sp. KR1-144 TaxID=3400911 RepID=UPI003C027198